MLIIIHIMSLQGVCLSSWRFYPWGFAGVLCLEGFVRGRPGERGQRVRCPGARIRGRSPGDQISKSFFNLLPILHEKLCTFFDVRVNTVIELSKWRWGSRFFVGGGSREEVGGVEIFHTGLKKRWGSNFVINFRRKIG